MRLCLTVDDSFVAHHSHVVFVQANLAPFGRPAFALVLASVLGLSTSDTRQGIREPRVAGVGATIVRVGTSCPILGSYVYWAFVRPFARVGNPPQLPHRVYAVGTDSGDACCISTPARLRIISKHAGVRACFLEPVLNRVRSNSWAFYCTCVSEEINKGADCSYFVPSLSGRLSSYARVGLVARSKAESRPRLRISVPF